MEKIIVDDVLREKLTSNGSEAELFDRSGQIVGYFYSPEAHLRLLYALAKAEDTDAEAELAWREFELHGGMTTAEVQDFLKTLVPGEGKSA